MLGRLLDYFYGLFNSIETIDFPYYLDEFYFDFLGIQGFTLSQYLALICSLISLIFIVVLCCLFIYRLIRLVGRLFSGGAL